MGRLQVKEKEMYNAQKHHAKVILTSGDVFVGRCTEFFSALNNEPDPASLIMENPMRNGKPFVGKYVEIELPEIQTIEVLDSHHPQGNLIEYVEERTDN